MADVKAKRPNVFVRAFQWLKEAKSDLKKVTWPSKRKVLINTIIVLVGMAVVSAIIFGMDSVIMFFFNRVLGL